MIKIENYEVVGWEHAIRGMRNPMNSWDKSDSGFKGVTEVDVLDNGKPKKQRIYFDALGIGPNDHELMMKLAKAGPVHGKFRRMITVYVDITAPLYWWKEFDTYKVGTVANSCSTMHKIHEKEFTLDDFSWNYLEIDVDDPEMRCCIRGTNAITPIDMLRQTIMTLNWYRAKYMEYKTKPMKNEAARKKYMRKYWEVLIGLLPTSYNQKRTVQLNYEVLANIYEYRKNHKLDEWVEFCKWIETLPYSEIITGEEVSE